MYTYFILSVPRTLFFISDRYMGGMYLPHSTRLTLHIPSGVCHKENQRFSPYAPYKPSNLKPKRYNVCHKKIKDFRRKCCKATFHTPVFIKEVSAGWG